MKRIYNTGRNGPNSLRRHYAKSLVDLVPQLKDVDVLAMEWDKLEEIGMMFATGNLNRQRGPFLRDLTMMGQDYEMFINTSTVSTNDCRASFIVHSHDTKIQNLSSFLQSKPHKNEVRILCIIGHGISEEQAKQLNENPPAFDNNQCKDSRKMKSCRWKWPLTNCNGKEGLGKGYTARSVCENARKGDIVVFESGFLTPEWIVEQLRTRELSTFFGTRKEIKGSNQNIAMLCINHVGYQWWEENCWYMKDAVPPNMIRSRSALLKSYDPTEQATV